MIYIYLHINGTLHVKPKIVVDMADGPYCYFEGPFVEKWWYVESQEKFQEIKKELRERNVCETDIEYVEIYLDSLKRRTQISNE